MSKPISTNILIGLKIGGRPQSYAGCLFILCKDKENLDNNLIAIIYLYAQFMELWIKFLIHNYDGFPENWTIKGLSIDNHNFLSIIKDEKTKNEFINRGIKEKDYIEIIKKIELLNHLCGTNNLSISFRFPIGKNNCLRLINYKLIISNKSDIIENILIVIYKSFDIIFTHIDGVRKKLSECEKPIKRYLKQHNINID